MKILITGAAGFLGYHLAYGAAQRGHRLTLVDDFSRGVCDEDFKALCKLPNVGFLEGNLTDHAIYKSLGSPFDAVYHLAAVNGTKNFYEKPDEVLRVDLLATLHMLDWHVLVGNRRYIFASTAETYAGHEVPIPTPETVPLVVPDPYNPRWSYGGSKIAGELLAIHYSKRYEFPMTILRYNNVYGPRAGEDHVVPAFIKRILLKEDPFAIYGAQATRTFGYVTDAVEASLSVLETEKSIGETIHVGSDLDGETKIADLASLMFGLFDFHPKIVEHAPPAGSPLRRCPQLRKMREILGVKPKVALREGLVKTFQWYKKYGKFG